MLLNHTADFADFVTAPQRAKEAAKTTIASPTLPLRPAETIAALDGATMVETENGWQPAAQLQTGDRVHTLDGGLVPVASAIQRTLPRYSTHLWFIPEGALDNCDALRITAGQRVLVTSTACERLYGAPDILIPVAALAGFRGIRPCSGLRSTDVTELTFEQEEIIFVQSGTMLICPSQSGVSDGYFRTLGYGEARGLLTLMEGAHIAPDVSAHATPNAA